MISNREKRDCIPATLRILLSLPRRLNDI
ncbi:unnamed protein product [Larinioides sclopetarius]|uniref:Uncharacterized protein n=1 Tax=Larinioides sclopetarius TaxID=280406 RepID=A0AAV2BJ21_9ARAC